MSYASNKRLEHMVLSALFLALAYVLPFLTGNNFKLGAAFLPMHIPVLLCGFLCGAPWGLAVGFIAPLMRSFHIGAPPILTAVTMAFELAAYGFFSGFLYRRLPKKTISCYTSLICAMMIGRVILGVVSYILSKLPFESAQPFTFSTFLTSSFVTAIPGIILQLVVIPPIVLAMRKFSILPGEV